MFLCQLLGVLRYWKCAVNWSKFDVCMQLTCCRLLIVTEALLLSLLPSAEDALRCSILCFIGQAYVGAI
jgi:hypothetical protein